MSSEQVVVENRRFDSAENESLLDPSRQFAAAFGYTAELSVDAGSRSAIAINVNVWTRLKLAEGATPAPA